MDIIIPYKNSRWNGTELRYALRSSVLYLPDIGNVFIIGDDPKIPNVIHIPAQDHENAVYKERNVYNKTMIACLDARVSDDFIFMNDDHFLLHGFDISKYYCMRWWDTPRTDMYGATVANTFNVCEPAYNFDVHCPIIINKKQFAQWVGMQDWEVKAGYCMKTLYADSIHANSELYTDMKIGADLLTYDEIMQRINGRLFWSINENCRTKEFLSVLENLYPHKTIYE